MGSLRGVVRWAAGAGAFLALAACQVGQTSTVPGASGPVGGDGGANGGARGVSSSAAGSQGAVVRTDLPAGFLRHEAEAAAAPQRGAGDTDYWILRPAASLFDLPCDTGTRGFGRAGVVTGRTAAHVSPAAGSTETVLVYRDAQAAVAAMAQVRTVPAGCAHPPAPITPLRYAVQPLAFGGEALRLVGSPTAGTGGEAWVVVRRGAAIAVYGTSGEFGTAGDSILGPLATAARAMSDKLCRYTVAGC